MRHRRRRWTFQWRKCECGLTWPCPDARSWGEGQPIPDGESRSQSALWNAPTIALPWLDDPQIGRAGRLTPAPSHRASAGRGW